MIGKATKKVEGGKLVRVEAEFDEKINRLKITGDFFAHPEEVIETVEKGLIGAGANENESDLTNKITSLTSSSFLVGITAQSLAQTILEAIANGRNGTSSPAA